MAFDFHFPEPTELKKCLNDFLEENVPQSYFIHDKKISKFLHNNDTEKILFLHFNVEPNQDSAFFLKAYLDFVITYIDGWYTSTSYLRDYIEKNKENFYKHYNQWVTNRIFSSDYIRDNYYKYVNQSKKIL